MHTSAPFGEGANITAFLHFRALMTLFRGVAIGFVEGTIAPTTPTGRAISVIPLSSSWLIIPTVLVFFRSLNKPIVLRLFFLFLSSTLPSPVCWTAISDNS